MSCLIQCPCAFFKKFIYYLFLAVLGLRFCARAFSLVAASGGHSSSWCAGLSLSRPLLLRSTGSRHAGSVVVAHGPSCSRGMWDFPDKGLNPCPLHWQADSQPLCHQGSPAHVLFTKNEPLHSPQPSAHPAVNLVKQLIALSFKLVGERNGD